MPNISKPREKHKPANSDDLREQPYNDRAVGPFEDVQLAREEITTLHAIVIDVDLHLLNRSKFTMGLNGEPPAFFEQTLATWLDNHPVLARAEVRDSGRGIHVLLNLKDPVVFKDDAERIRWDGIVQALQACLPSDPRQPGITGLTRPLGSVNSRTGREVRVLKSGEPIDVAEIEQFFNELSKAPFRSVTRILFGRDRLDPCPLCQQPGSQMSALDRVGKCYTTCGEITLAKIYDMFLKTPDRKSGVKHGKNQG